MTIRIVATTCLGPELPAAERTACCQALGRLSESVAALSHSHAGLHLEGSVGAGDLTWDIAVRDAASLDAVRRRLDRDGWQGLFASAGAEDRERLAGLAQIEAWVVEPIDGSVPRPALPGIKRTNLVRVRDGARPESVEQWARACVALPDRVPAIRNWSFGRVAALGPTSPRVRWTHAWEQEFEVLEGLSEDYMASPYHWGFLDGWYDPEMPQCIMDPDLAHLYCSASQNVLRWTRG